MRIAKRAEMSQEVLVYRLHGVGKESGGFIFRSFALPSPGHDHHGSDDSRHNYHHHRDHHRDYHNELVGSDHRFLPRIRLEIVLSTV